MAHGDQLGRPLRRLNTGDARRRQDVALGDGVVGHQGGGLGQHGYPAPGQGTPVSRLPGRDVGDTGAT